ncbi:hypothetical protein, partial [Neobacillus sp. Marseille-QA0830]
LFLSIIFRINWLSSISLIPVYGTFILLYSFAVNYFNSYKTSYQNDLAILDKYASLKSIAVSMFIVYLDINFMFIIKTLIPNPFATLLIVIFGFLVHFAVYLVFIQKIKKGWKNFYGEYAKSVY